MLLQPEKAFPIHSTQVESMGKEIFLPPIFQECLLALPEAEASCALVVVAPGEPADLSFSPSPPTYPVLPPVFPPTNMIIPVVLSVLKGAAHPHSSPNSPSSPSHSLSWAPMHCVTVPPDFPIPSPVLPVAL